MCISSRTNSPSVKSASSSRRRRLKKKNATPPNNSSAAPPPSQRLALLSAMSSEGPLVAGTGALVSAGEGATLSSGMEGWGAGAIGAVSTEGGVLSSTRGWALVTVGREEAFEAARPSLLSGEARLTGAASSCACCRAGSGKLCTTGCGGVITIAGDVSPTVAGVAGGVCKTGGAAGGTTRGGAAAGSATCATAIGIVMGERMRAAAMAAVADVKRDEICRMRAQPARSVAVRPPLPNGDGRKRIFDQPWTIGTCRDQRGNDFLRYRLVRERRGA